MVEIRHYISVAGRNIFSDWLQHLRDPVAKIQIVKRVNRLGQGNFGDHKPCRGGVWELRIDVGAGYRIYYARSGRQLVLLLCGGDKRTQGADLDRAVANWLDWQRRTGE